MDNRKLSEKESISLIAEMISRTKERYIGDGNIMLMWGWLTIAVTGAVWLLLELTHNGQWNWLWFLIPVIGGIATPIMAKKTERQRGVKTYSDRITSQIWTAVSIIAVVSVIFCLGFYSGGIHIWNVMFVYALIIVPFAEIAQGLIVKENCLVVGGACGMTIGIFTVCCLIGGMRLYAYWFLLAFMVAFACMMLIPGYVVNYKARRQ